MKKIDPALRISNGRLTQVGDSFLVRTGSCSSRSCAVFQCDCGNRTLSQIENVRNGNTKSCGCLNAEVTRLRSTTHGHSKKGTHTRTYRTWACMKQRCSEYGGAVAAIKYKDRGITVCERWMSYENFLDDMGEAPPGMSIDRIDNNAGYSKDNCRWATATQQARNKRNTVMVRNSGTETSLRDAAAKAGLDCDTVYARIRRGWPVDQALSVPIVRGANQVTCKRERQ